MTRAAAVDTALVRRARRGDRAAFGALVRRHLAAAYVAVCVVLDGPAAAEEVVHDAFLVALERLDDCRPEDAFGSWLVASARDRALDRHRRGRCAPDPRPVTRGAAPVRTRDVRARVPAIHNTRVPFAGSS